MLAIIDVVSSPINPFDSGNTDLLSLSSGAIADDDTKTDLLSAEEYREVKLLTAFSDRGWLTSRQIFFDTKDIKTQNIWYYV